MTIVLNFDGAFAMLTLNPPLAALHGARLDHSSAFSHGVLSTLEHLTASLLRLNNEMLGQLAQRVRERDHQLSPLSIVAAASDPAIARLGTDIVREQIHLSADVGIRLIALGEWHQHSANAVAANWIAHCREQWRGLPASSGLSVLMTAVESVDRSVEQAAAVAASAAEVAAEEAARLEVAAPPRRRVRKQ